MDSAGSGLRRVIARWRVPASRRRQFAAVALNLVPALVAIAALVWLAPATSWSQPALLGALAGIAATAYFAEAGLKSESLSFFGATLIAALVALAIAGPLAALAVWVVPDVIARFVLRREPRLSPGLVATVSSYAIACFAGAELLELAGSPSGAAVAPALFSAGVAMWALNFCVGRLAVAPFYQGYRPAALIRDEFIAFGPAVLAMLVVGVATALLVAPLGLGALAMLAAVILVPQLALERIVAARSTARLSPADALRLYVAAIADVLDLSRDERRKLACAADLIEPVDDPVETEGLEWRLDDVSEAAFLALHSTERWAGDGGPGGLPAEAIPRGSRILAIARAWAALTASGTAQLCQREAILALAAQAGRAFDPAIVEAAARVVSDEEGFAREPSFEPRLHRLMLPRALRRRALPALLARLIVPGRA